MKTYKAIAKYQNMSIARAKAIDILEFILKNTGINPKGENWYMLEDSITKIIEKN